MYKRQGITRTNKALESADLILEVADASAPRTETFPTAARTAPRLLILNKCDLGIHPDWEAVPAIRFSCATGAGRKELEEAIVQAFASSLPGEMGSSLVAINARHQHELGLCLEHVRLASESISRQESPEFTALELREALTHLAVSYTHLRAHETRHDLVCRLLLEKKKRKNKHTHLNAIQKNETRQ